MEGLLVIRPNLASASTGFRVTEYFIVEEGGFLEPTDLATLAQTLRDWERARELLQAFG
jgi:hypothetical protein